MVNIEAILANECALTKERPLIAGVSGGADSLCLMDVLRGAGYRMIVGHFDHQLRQESKRDAQAVKRICEKFQIECVVESADAGAYAKDKKLSIEEAARELRYRFLFKLARERNAQAVAVGHTADDQAETILMHIVRGSSLNGLKGMSYRAVIDAFDKTIPLVRPLLETTRAETTAHCQTRGLQFLRDASNDSLEYRRNRIRHELIPMLETYNPRMRRALLRLSQTIKDDLEILDSLEDSLWRTCAGRGDGFVALELSLLANSAAGLQRRLILRAMRTLIPGLDATYETLNRAIHVVANRRRSSGGEAISARADLQSGLYLFREGSQVYVCKKNAELPLSLFPQLPVTPAFAFGASIAGSDSDDAISKTGEGSLRLSEARNDMIPLSIPAEINLPNGWTFTAQALEQFEAGKIFANENRSEAWFDADALTESLCLRKPRAGDKIRPLGLNGRSQKLSDLFVNQKIPRRARGNWALLCAGDEILWVAGLRPSHAFRVTEGTKRVVHASLTKS